MIQKDNTNRLYTEISRLSKINPTKTKETYAGAGNGKFTMGKLKSSLFFHKYVQRQCRIPFRHEHRNAIGQGNPPPPGYWLYDNE